MELITRAEAANRLDMSVRTLDRIIQSGRLPRYKLSEGIVRLSVEDIESYKASCRETSAPVPKASRKKAARRPKANNNWRPGEKLV